MSLCRYTYSLRRVLLLKKNLSLTNDKYIFWHILMKHYPTLLWHTTVLSLDQCLLCASIPFLWCRSKSILLSPSLVLKHSRADLKSFATLPHHFSAGYDSYKFSSFQAAEKGYQFCHSFRNTKYTAQETQIHFKRPHAFGKNSSGSAFKTREQCSGPPILVNSEAL